MEFSPQDILNLYGSRLYLVPEIEQAETEVAQVETIESESVEATAEVPEVIPATQPDVSLLAQGKAIDWKLKPQAQLAFVLHKSEFTNRDLTKLLKESVQAAKIDLSKIGFGILEGEAGTTWNFSDMPVSVALVCYNLGENWSSPTQLNDKHLYFSPTLQEAQQQPQSKTALSEVLHSLSVLLNS